MAQTTPTPTSTTSSAGAPAPSTTPAPATADILEACEAFWTEATTLHSVMTDPHGNNTLHVITASDASKLYTDLKKLTSDCHEAVKLVQVPEPTEAPPAHQPS